MRPLLRCDNECTMGTHMHFCNRACGSYEVLRLCGVDGQTGSATGASVGLSLKDFLSLSGMGGCQTKMVLGRVCHDTTPLSAADVQQAVTTVNENFKFVGIMEQWEESVRLLHQMYGGGVVDVELVATRQTTKKKSVRARVVERVACLMMFACLCACTHADRTRCRFATRPAPAPGGDANNVPPH